MENILNISSGLDIHKDSIEACILINNGTNELTIIRETFSTLRGDLIKLRIWLAVKGCYNVAMESTGVYWKPVYEVLEGLPNANICLVNAYHMRNVPGRKTDVKDAEWISTLYMYGLLRKSFVPEREIRCLREYTRFHYKNVQERARHVNRIEKFLQTHGFKLSSVLSSIVNNSGKRILKKLSIQGYVSTFDVETAIDKRVKKTSEEIAYAVNGNLDEPSRVLLKTMLDKLNSHDEQIKTFFDEMIKVSKPFSHEIELIESISGLATLSSTYILAEIGNNMSAFKTDKHLASWAGLSPRNDESAGVIKSKKILKGNSYVKSILCECAWAAIKRRNTRLSNWYWRNVKRLGEKKAIIAVARKLLCYIFHILSKKTPYDNKLDALDTEKINALKLDSAKKQVSMLEKNVGVKSTEDKKTADTVVNDVLEQETSKVIRKPAAKTRKTKKSTDAVVNDALDQETSEVIRKPAAKTRKIKKSTDAVVNDALDQEPSPCFPLLLSDLIIAICQCVNLEPTFFIKASCIRNIKKVIRQVVSLQSMRIIS